MPAGASDSSNMARIAPELRERKAARPASSTMKEKYARYASSTNARGVVAAWRAARTRRRASAPTSCTSARKTDSLSGK